MSELDTSVRENPLVAKIVNQEIRRRRRLIWLYMGLLLVPLLSALGFLVYGRSDRELIHLEVATEARSQREKMAVLQNQVNDLQVQVQQLQQAVHPSSEVRPNLTPPGPATGRVAHPIKPGPPADLPHRHPHQHADQAAGVVGRQFPQRRPGQEASQDGLAHVLAVELPAERGVGQAGTDRHPHRRAVDADEFFRRLGLAAAEAGQ